MFRAGQRPPLPSTRQTMPFFFYSVGHRPELLLSRARVASLRSATFSCPVSVIWSASFSAVSPRKIVRCLGESFGNGASGAKPLGEQSGWGANGASASKTSIGTPLSGDVAAARKFSKSRS